jgi:hypothetical protein
MVPSGTACHTGTASQSSPVEKCVTSVNIKTGYAMDTGCTQAWPGLGTKETLDMDSSMGVDSQFGHIMELRTRANTRRARNMVKAPIPGQMGRYIEANGRRI